MAMTAKDYSDAVDSTAKDTYEEFVEAVKRDPDMRYPDDELREIMDSQIDSDLNHLDCNDVMRHTDNPDYFTSEIGGEATGDWDAILRSFCRWAYYADVNDSFYSNYGSGEDIVKEVRVELGLDKDEDEDWGVDDDDDDEDVAPVRAPAPRIADPSTWKPGDDDFDGVTPRRGLFSGFMRKRGR